MQGANYKGADQTVQISRLICPFVVHIKQSQVLSHRGLHSAGKEKTHFSLFSAIGGHFLAEKGNKFCFQ